MVVKSKLERKIIFVIVFLEIRCSFLKKSYAVLALGRASERNFFRGYEGRYQAPKSYWAPQALPGPMP